MRFRIASLEIEIDSNRPDLVSDLTADWVGYRSEGGAPDVSLAFEAIEGYSVPQPPSRYPGYAPREASANHVVLERGDGRLAVDLPPDGPIAGRLRGLAAPWTLATAIRALLSFALPRVGGLLLHSAGVSRGDRALVFSGPSGAGKSTVSGFLHEEGWISLGDDLTALRPSAAGIDVHATPFSGAPHDAAVPLRAICFPVKTTRHHLTPLRRADALARLLRNTIVFAEEPALADRVLAAAAAIAGVVPMAILEFARDPSVVEFLAGTSGLDLS